VAPAAATVKDCLCRARGQGRGEPRRGGTDSTAARRPRLGAEVADGYYHESVSAPMRRILDFLRLDDLPPLTRPNYLAELRQIPLWGVVLGTVEASLVSVVASKTFGASPLLTTIVWAIPVVMNLLNLVWGALLRGRRRKPAFLLLVACGSVAVGSVGLTSADWRPWGGWLFAAQIALVHFFVSGLVTLRTTMWQVNYPVTHRGRIAGRLQTLQLLLAAIASLLLSLLYDRDPLAYRFVYPLVGLIGLASLLPIRRLHMRGEQRELRRFEMYLRQVNHGRSQRGLGIWSALREAVGILRSDKLFARYMLAQFLLGSSNFFTDPFLVNVLSKDLAFDYFTCQALMFLIPTAVLLLSIRFWAAFFDRVGVLGFRMHNSAVWVISYAAAAVALLLLAIGGRAWLLVALPVLIVGRVFNGLGSAGGKIAWNLGHLYFAREHQTELYMGIHVGLTGVRGLIMPLLGLLAGRAFGYGALLIAVGLGLVAHALFRRMLAGSERPAAGQPGAAAR